jgi:hypothetical protein
VAEALACARRRPPQLPLRPYHLTDPLRLGGAEHFADLPHQRGGRERLLKKLRAGVEDPVGAQWELPRAVARRDQKATPSVFLSIDGHSVWTAV